MLERLAQIALIASMLGVSTDALAQSDDDNEDQPAPSNPHGHGGASNNPLDQIPQDQVGEAPQLPNGTLEIMIVDALNKPIGATPVTLGIVFNSVAKGESRKRVQATTNEAGIAKFEHLDTGSAVAYRPMVLSGDATFAMTPFRMPDHGGMRAALHVYPVSDDMNKTTIVSQAITYTEVKDDRVQIQQAYTIYNIGRTAWVPKDYIIPLPEEFTAFSEQQGMTDVGVDAIPKKGLRLHGTFAPGQHVIEFRWQLPYNGEPEVKYDVGMPPHTAAARVLAPASRDMTMEVPGFPPPKTANDGQGQRELVTEKAIKDGTMDNVEVIIRGLPTEGPGKIIATLLAGAGLLFGLVIGSRKPEPADKKTERARLLEEIEELERAKVAGDVGPKTYERARRELLDALARTFATDPPATAAPAKKKGKA